MSGGGRRQEGRRGREGRGGEGREVEEEVSQSSAFPSDQRTGNSYSFPFSSASLPPFSLQFLPL